jgi:hypothetical protein
MSGITSASVIIQWNPSDAVPYEPPAARVAWLAAHGPAPTAAETTLEMPLIEWIRFRVRISPQGTVTFPGYDWRVPDAPHAIKRRLGELYAQTGEVPDTVPEALWRAAVDEIDQAYDAIAEKTAQEKRAQAEKDARDALTLDERARVARHEGLDRQVVRDEHTRAWRVVHTNIYGDAIAEAAFGATWRHQAAALADARNARETAEHRATVDAWLAAHGTASQRARSAEGLLDEHELLGAVRAYVFAGFAALPRYVRMVARDHAHDDACAGEAVKFEVDGLTTLTAEQYEVLAQLRLAVTTAPIPLNIELRRHKAWCNGCEGSDDVRTCDGALVSGQWAGHALSREYAL